MSNFTYTKKVIMDNMTVEGAYKHNCYADDHKAWYQHQCQAGLADPLLGFLPHEYVSNTVCHILVADQVQANSFIAMMYAQAKKIQCPLSATVVDHNGSATINT